MNKFRTHTLVLNSQKYGNAYDEDDDDNEISIHILLHNFSLISSLNVCVCVFGARVLPLQARRHEEENDGKKTAPKFMEINDSQAIHKQNTMLRITLRSTLYNLPVFFSLCMVFCSYYLFFLFLFLLIFLFFLVAGSRKSERDIVNAVLVFVFLGTEDASLVAVFA